MTDILQKHGITFDEARHAYTSKAGFPLPSVTQILPFKCEGAEDVIRKAAERGHRVHKWIERTERLELNSYPLGSDVPYCNAWLKFKEITGFELARLPLAKATVEADHVNSVLTIDVPSLTPMVERFVYHKDFQYVGRLDLIGYLRRIPKIENDLTLVDAKTGLVSPATSLQTAAYMAAINLELKSLGLPLVKHRWAAKLLPTGECKREHWLDHKGDFATFLNRLGWMRWATLHKYETFERDYFVEPELTDEPELSVSL